MRPAEVLPKAKAAALKALEKDEMSAIAHVSLGLVRLWYEWDWNGARAAFERALDIAPNDPICRLCYGYWLNAMGRHQEAIAEASAAVDLAPLSSIASYNLALVYDAAGLADEAIEQYRKTVELNPSSLDAHALLALSYARKGMYEEALECVENRALNKNDASSRSLLARVYALSGKREEARACLEELKRDGQSLATRGLVFIYAALGDCEDTFACLEKSYEERDVYLIFLPILPEFRHLHGDPRFVDLVRRIGLPQPRESEIKRAWLP